MEFYASCGHRSTALLGAIYPRFPIDLHLEDIQIGRYRRSHVTILQPRFVFWTEVTCRKALFGLLQGMLLVATLLKATGLSMRSQAGKPRESLY